MTTKLYTFFDLFLSDIETKDGPIQLAEIIIPKIQRDYAQGRINNEVDRIRSSFLEALKKSILESPITLDFIYGSIEKLGNQKYRLVPLDGQQRLTTLFLLHWYAGKKEHISDEETAFLNRFSYDTRASARDFCKYLVKFTPSFANSIKDEIINEAWFPLEWNKDPTVRSMLVMIEEIDKQFRTVEDLWERLKNRAITFYFLPLEDMELTDELYIKMNSRGKPLSTFEHFKAELERTLREADPQLSQRILNKIDINWTDMLWTYRGEDNIIDDEFLRYFKFICDVICYKNGESAQNRGYDEFLLLKTYFSKDDEHLIDHVKIMEQFFDCWCNIPGGKSPEGFLNDIISKDGYQPGKILVERAEVDIFRNCLNTYSIYRKKNREFSLARMVLFFSICTYLINQDSVSLDEFRQRLRIVNNLVRNSSDEISDSTNRIGGNRIPAILQQVEKIILHNEIDLSIERGFNAHQLREEAEKQEWLSTHPEMRETISRAEDHALLNGQIGILGIEKINYFGRFQSLFNCDWDKVDCALMSIGFYAQSENEWRYLFGSSSSRHQTAWRNLFHRSSNGRYDETKRILCDLLDTTEEFDNNLLDRIIQDYIQDCEHKHQYEWRYYYVKYPQFRPGSYGKYINGNFAQNPYCFRVMETDSYPSGNTYNPFLKIVDSKNVSKDHIGKRLVYDEISIGCENDAFVVYQGDTDTEMERVPVAQNEYGIDVIDRTTILRSYLLAHNLLQEESQQV